MKNNTEEIKRHFYDIFTYRIKIGNLFYIENDLGGRNYFLFKKKGDFNTEFEVFNLTLMKNQIISLLDIFNDKEEFHIIYKDIFYYQGLGISSSHRSFMDFVSRKDQIKILS